MLINLVQTMISAFCNALESSPQQARNADGSRQRRIVIFVNFIDDVIVARQHVIHLDVSQASAAAGQVTETVTDKHLNDLRRCNLK